MSGIGLARGISGLAIPAVLAVVWWRRRVPGADRERSTTVSPHSDVSREQHTSRRELRSRIRNGADLSLLDLRGVSLGKSDMRGRTLAGSDLSRAKLPRARLCDADLSDANLDFADLSGSDLRRANLSGASLLETSLYGADLRGADLSRCRNLIMANLRRATYDSTTKWPGRLDARTLGATLDKDGNGSPNRIPGP